MKLLESTYEKLCEITELIINWKFSSDPHEIWETNEELIADIKMQEQFNKYDGDIDNYDTIYWYFKGINIRNKKK